MSKLFARIAITLPRKDLSTADRLARALDRSRSWVVAEAIRRYAAGRLAGGESTAGVADGASAPAPPAAGLGESRQQQLVRDLALTPEDRVRAAEETARLSELRQGGRPRAQTLRVFERYLDYVDWKRTRDAGR